MNYRFYYPEWNNRKEVCKDYDLVRKYGESAMEARSFGTDRKAVKKDYAKGGLIGPAYRHSNKDYRKGGLFK